MNMVESARGKIGVFDSGFGGVVVLRGLVAALPQYDYLYLGDAARVPYGTRSTEEVYNFTRQGVDFLFAHGAEMIIIACNTASSEALRKIQREYMPAHHLGKVVLGVLIPGAEEAVLQTKGGRIGVMATEGTVRSGAFVRELTKLKPETQVFQVACPELVPLIESGSYTREEAIKTLVKYLEPLRQKDIDTLILGCTHYEVLAEVVQEIVGKDITIITESGVVAKKCVAYLERHQHMEKKLARGNNVTFYTTGDRENFEESGSIFFGREIVVKQIVL